jgi:predicted enzyme related to lactoylglutathione lyase
MVNIELLPKGALMAEGPSHEFTRGLYGWITHTELASDDPEATREWCESVLGWTFQDPFPTAAGDYHLFSFSESGGGGIRGVGEDETPGSTPTVHVENTDVAYQAALDAGAVSVDPPTDVMAGVRIAMVRAPGGVLIGLSGPTD